MINGVALSTRNLYKELKSMGHDVRIMTLSSDGMERFEDDVYYLKSFKVRIYPGARAKVPFMGDMVDHILEWSPDIIHTQTEFSTMATAKVIKNKLKIPQVHTYHTMYEDYLGYFLKGMVIRKGTAKRLTRLLLNTCESVVAPTEKVKEALNSYGVQSPLYIVPTGIELNKFKEEISDDFKNKFYEKYGLCKDDILLGYVGRIAKEKNIQEIINFCKNIENPNVKLLVVGGGPYLGELKKEACNNDKVIFTDMIDPKEIHKYYKLCHIFVTASKSETQGLTYVEALSSGCPVICREDKAVSQLIKNGFNGYMYNNEEEFINFVSKMINDKVLYNNMCKNADKSAEPYSTKCFAQKILQIYEQTLKIRNAA